MVIKFNGKDITQLFLGNIELNAVYKDGVLYFGGTASSSGGGDSGGGDSGGGSGGGSTGGGGSTTPPTDSPNLVVTFNDDGTVHFKEGNYVVQFLSTGEFKTMHLTEAQMAFINDQYSPDQTLARRNGYDATYLTIQVQKNGVDMEAIFANSENAFPQKSLFVGYLCYSEQFDKYYFSDSIPT